MHLRMSCESETAAGRIEDEKSQILSAFSGVDLGREEIMDFSTTG